MSPGLPVGLWFHAAENLHGFRLRILFSGKALWLLLLLRLGRTRSKVSVLLSFRPDPRTIVNARRCNTEKTEVQENGRTVYKWNGITFNFKNDAYRHMCDRKRVSADFTFYQDPRSLWVDGSDYCYYCLLAERLSGPRQRATQRRGRERSSGL